MLQGEHSAILSTFIKLQFVIKIFVLSIFEWTFYIGFTVHKNIQHYKYFIISALNKYWTRADIDCDIIKPILLLTIVSLSQVSKGWRRKSTDPIRDQILES